MEIKQPNEEPYRPRNKALNLQIDTFKQLYNVFLRTVIYCWQLGQKKVFREEISLFIMDELQREHP